mgnify:CR=1 FL=1|jgi:hypothetical protein
MTHIPVPLRFKLYCWWVDTKSALKEYHHKIVRRIMKDVKCNGCGQTISVYRMEHHLNYKVNGITICQLNKEKSNADSIRLTSSN